MKINYKNRPNIRNLQTKRCCSSARRRASCKAGDNEAFDIIYRQLKKLEKVEECHVLEKFKKEDLKGIRDIRNWSSRDYENMQNKMMEEMIHRELPKLKNTQIDKTKSIFIKIYLIHT